VAPAVLLVAPVPPEPLPEVPLPDVPAAAELVRVPLPDVEAAAPVPPTLAAGLAPVTPAGEALLVVLPVEEPPVLEALLKPLVVLVDPEVLPITPEHGATVGDVALVLVGEIVTPATLQFSGICCSMISM